jgi:metallophosphoesterase superfamily enzyme
MLDKLIEHFMENGKTDSWLNLAKQFNILPYATNKQRSDKVRKLYNKDIRTLSDKIRSMNGFTEKHDRPGIGGEIFKVSIPKEAFQVVPKLDEFEEFLQWKHDRNKSKIELTPYLNGDVNNVLVVSDLHIPFELPGALEFCRKQQEKFNCGTIVFIGDIIDNHAQSFHDSDPDGMSAKDELNLAALKLQDWYKVFPNAVVTIGNHDRINARKLFSIGLSKRWLKPLGEILGVPNWKFVEEFIFNDVLYVHGEGGQAIKKCRDEMISVVSGHHHTEGYVNYAAGYKNQCFAMQVGTLIDFNTYAFAYAQRGKKPILSCGVVLGNHPILIPYNEAN